MHTYVCDSIVVSEMVLKIMHLKFLLDFLLSEERRVYRWSLMARVSSRQYNRECVGIHSLARIHKHSRTEEKHTIYSTFENIFFLIHIGENDNN